MIQLFIVEKIDLNLFQNCLLKWSQLPMTDLIWHDPKCQIQVQFEFSVILKKDQWLRNHGMTPNALVTCQG